MKREKNKTGRFSFFLFSFFSLLFSLSCGLENYLYLDYIRDGIINDNTYAKIELPTSLDEGYSSFFDNFLIYYRIYISDTPDSGIINTSESRNKINSSLNSDFSGFYSLTDKSSTSANPSGLETVFTNRKYFKLTLENYNIDNILGSGALSPSRPGQTLEILFSGPNGVKPVLKLNGVSYTLQRAVTGPGLNFRPEPDRFFLNHYDLYNIQNVNENINADTAAIGTQPNPGYTYVSMYIFAIGRDYLDTIYSQPTHIGVFRLPEAN